MDCAFTFSFQDLNDDALMNVFTSDNVAQVISLKVLESRTFHNVKIEASDGHFNSFDSLGADNFVSDLLNVINPNCSYVFPDSITSNSASNTCLFSPIISVAFPIILMNLICNVDIRMVLI